LPEQASEWLSKKAWYSLLELEDTFPEYGGFIGDFVAHLAQWRKIYDSEAPHEQRFPGRWDKLEIYKKIMVLRLLTPDKFAKVFIFFFRFKC
jgi:hypothetical protein